MCHVRSFWLVLHLSGCFWLVKPVPGHCWPRQIVPSQIKDLQSHNSSVSRVYNWWCSCCHSCIVALPLWPCFLWCHKIVFSHYRRVGLCAGNLHYHHILQCSINCIRFLLLIATFHRILLFYILLHCYISSRFDNCYNSCILQYLHFFVFHNCFIAFCLMLYSPHPAKFATFHRI